MFKPAALFIGLRYIRAKRRNHFVSFISLISMFGIALGVIVLITVLSVLNGFDREIKKQIFGMISPITINNYVGPMEHWRKLMNDISKSPDVVAVAPFISGQAMLLSSEFSMPVMITGIIPDEEKRISSLADKMVQGDLWSLKPGYSAIVIGEELADRLGVAVGDDVTVATQKNLISTTSIVPEFNKFTVRGIFRAGGGGFSFDTRYTFIHLNDAQKLFNLGSAVSALHVNIHEIYDAPRIAHKLQSQLSPPVRVGNWTEQLGDFFENIRITKTMMFFIFIMIIAVAVFNLICTMVMAVRSKHADIAILRTLGATPAMILIIFIVQGAVIGVGGTLLGVIGGIALACNVTVISTWIQDVFNTQLISSNIYFVNYLPSELQWPDVLLISLVALLLSLIATLYPAWSASRLDPADVLRNE